MKAYFSFQSTLKALMEGDLTYEELRPDAGTRFFISQHPWIVLMDASHPNPDAALHPCMQLLTELHNMWVGTELPPCPSYDDIDPELLRHFKKFNNILREAHDEGRVVWKALHTLNSTWPGVLDLLTDPNRSPGRLDVWWVEWHKAE